MRKPQGASESANNAVNAAGLLNIYSVLSLPPTGAPMVARAVMMHQAARVWRQPLQDIADDTHAPARARRAHTHLRNARARAARTQPTTQPTNQPSIHPSVRPSVRPSIHPSIHAIQRHAFHPSKRSVHPSIHPPIHPCTHPPIHPPIHPPTLHPAVHHRAWLGFSSRTFPGTRAGTRSVKIKPARSLREVNHADLTRCLRDLRRSLHGCKSNFEHIPHVL